jgi:hypothetical protein
LKRERETRLQVAKSKLEKKQDKTQQEMETLERIKIVYKLTSGKTYQRIDFVRNKYNLYK